MYKKDLNEEIKNNTSGYFRNILISLLQTNRSINISPDNIDFGKSKK